ncbi:MAG: Asp-tRNA(Asn)/Glu-tRNA(Gln) amidotransferase subunit GatB [Candidatus Gottesmanbacteria bacterium]
MTNAYELVIGLEVHVELKTNSKMFCGCSADHFGKAPNTQTCPVCLALPGALPVPNKKAIEWCIKLGLALNCTIPEESKFDRKNYFYPDLAKGYQISQYDKPLSEHGWMQLKNTKVRIARVHQEEDTGKLQHVTVDGERLTLVDFNRCGVPLVEIVTEPDFHSIDEVDQYVKKLQRIVRYIDISGADMEKGTMRLEPSISLRKVGSIELPPYRVELKNINSFRFVRKAIEYEVVRQSEMLDKGEVPIQQTRGWSESQNVTLPQRSKEDAHDYRYFPEPDIPPMHFTKEFIEDIKKTIPTLPDEYAEQMKKYGLSEQDISVLTENGMIAAYFIATAKLADQSLYKQIANMMVNKKIDYTKISSEAFIKQLKNQEQENTVSEGSIIAAIDVVLTANTKAVDDYKKGKTSALMFLVGMVRRELKGKGDASVIEQELKKRLT